MKYDSDFNVDEIASFDAFVSEVKKVMKEEPPQTLLIDGIGELRDYATAKWAKTCNRKKPVNPGDWEQINDLVRDTLFPLINWARWLQINKQTDINIIFTSQLKDDYTVIEREGKKESVKCGRIPAHKEWISYNVDLLADLSINKKTGQYFVDVTKSPVGMFSQDITGKSLYSVLQERGL